MYSIFCYCWILCEVVLAILDHEVCLFRVQLHCLDAGLKCQDSVLEGGDPSFNRNLPEHGLKFYDFRF